METAIVTTVPAIRVNPDVLKWAREERGLDRATAAGLLGIPESELADYEGGTKTPMLGLLGTMAEKYEINRVSLFMPARPATRPHMPDYRTKSGGEPRALTQETILAIQEVRDALEAFADVRRADPDAIPLPRLDEVLTNEKAEDLAKRQRKALGLGIDPDRSLRTHSQARDYWRQLVEAQGVFVYLLNMDLEDCRGFSLFHEGLAAICVNDREENPGAESFTLWHEFCHLLRRQIGISDENRTNRVEQYCNRFAGAFLVPTVPLRGELNSPIRPAEYPTSVVASLANRFKVSQRAIALRLEQTGLAPEGYYNRHTAAWDRPRQRKDTDKPVIRSRSAVDVAERSFGRRHTLTVFRALRRGALNSSEASGLLRVQPTSFDALLARVE
jgi:Zn-dependent peptidase ImmA (M78 family)/transcriptional regulator with XRE-family HTH domain